MRAGLRAERPGAERAPFVGRQDEGRRLEEALGPVLSGQASHAVLILAPTGGGKTAFVEHVAPGLEARGATVVGGKFDQVVRDVPYAALVEALRAWLRRASAPGEVEQVRKDLRLRLGASASVLGGLLPELALFLGDLPGASSLGIFEGHNRFQFAVLALLRAMTDGGRACLLFLDDLQWADEATLAFVVRICRDAGLPRVGFLLNHRSDDEEALARTLRAFRPLGGALLTRLELPALSADEVGALLALSRRAEPGPDAARTLLARTGGNPLFVSELLRWEKAPGPGEEVSDLLLRRLKDFGQDQQDLLAAAAMMGSRVEAATLAAALGREEPAVRGPLEQAVADEILVRDGADGYRFRHDQLQRAALDLLPAARRPSLHARLGKVWGERAVGGDAAVAFDAAYHLHLAGGDELRLLAARVDLLCARRARLAAAERSAFEHASRGCELLGEAGWTDAYDLTLNLHTETACAAFAVGEAEAFQRLAAIVKERARSFIDELPMQEVLVVALTGSGDVPAAFDLVREGARWFGLSLPGEPGADDVAAADRRIDLALETMTPEWLEKADRVADPSVVALLRVLGLGNAAAYTARPHLLRLLVTHELDLSARHGFSDVTALALAYLAALDCASPETVRRGLGLRARALAAARRVTDGAVLARTLDIVHGMTSTWTGPLRDAVGPLLENARLGLEHGAFDYAGYSALKGTFFALLSGAPLDEVAARLDAWRHTLGDLGQRLAGAYLARDRQVVELLRRRSAAPALVSGEFSDEAACWQDYDAQDDHYGALYLAVGKLLLAAVFMVPAAAAEAYERLARHAKGGHGLPLFEFGRFYAAVCAWDAFYAGQTERAQAAGRIGEALAGCAAGAELVPATFEHKRQLLRALLADLRGDLAEALEAFERALEGARAAGYVHEAGLAADRASRVCARVGSWERAEGHRLAAEEAWTDWGASARTSRSAGAGAAGEPPTQREAEAFAAAPDEAHALERLLASVPRWLGARRAWLVRVGEGLELIGSAEGDRVRCHPTLPEPLCSVPALDPTVLTRVATAAATREPVPGPAPAGGLTFLPLVFEARTHGVLALELPRGHPPAATLVAASLACGNVAAVVDAARLQDSLSRQAHERDRTEAALRKSTALLRNVLDATRAVVYVKGVDGRYLLVNRTFTELFGLSEDGLTEKTDFDVYPREVAQPLRDNDLEVLRSRKPLERVEEVPVHGEPRTWITVKVPLLSEDGLPFAVCGVSTDITQLRRTEEALRRSGESLRQAEKLTAIGQLAGGIAHDFNNQLGGILGAASLLATQLTDPHLRQHVDMIRQAATRSAALTKQLLAFARKGKTLSVPVDVHAVLGDVVTLLEGSIDKRITVRQVLTAAPHHVLGDPTLLQSALLNLALNARDAMPSGGELVFSTAVAEGADAGVEAAHADDRFLEIGVTDTGCGMDEETKRRLFEPFFTTKDVGKGSGLGLAAVHGTVESHHGAIKVRSELGHGSTFALYLPLLEEPPAAVPSPPAPAAVPGTGRLLVVDDEPVVRQIVEATLRKLGYEVVTAVDGQAAVTYYREHWRGIDLVILDLLMPRLGGQDAFRAMRDINPGVRALLASASIVDGEPPAIMREGALGFLQKPFDMVGLSQKVAAALKAAPPGRPSGDRERS